MGLFITSVVVALCVSGFCSLIESVLLSLSPTQVAEISKQYPKLGDIWTQFKNNIEKPIAIILLLNTTAHTIGASLAGSAFNKIWGDHWIWLFSLIFTFLMLQYTEILPKTLGVRFNKRIAILFARPLAYAVEFLSPFITLIHFFNRPFEPKNKPNDHPSTVDEINIMASMARQHHLIGLQQEQIITSATKLSKMPVKDVMIPMDEVVILSTSMSLWDALEVAHLDGHTRFPVCYNFDKSDIRGYVNFKEIISHQRLNPKATTFLDIIRPISFVPPGSFASDLLRKFIVHHEHIAIVRDTAGICLGMVALEDIVEELVGEIEDEFDRLPQHIHLLPNNILIFGGGCLMSEVKKFIVKNISNAKFNETLLANVDNINLTQWLQKQNKRRLKRGDRITCGNIEFIVRRIRRQKVFDVSVQKSIEGLFLGNNEKNA
ncbi:MAG: hemolysin family protein [Planctomycetia bacterium]|nr:hemolysin family protein [Planctomycetia bacterium]